MSCLGFRKEVFVVTDLEGEDRRGFDVVMVWEDLHLMFLVAFNSSSLINPKSCLYYI